MPENLTYFRRHNITYFDTPGKNWLICLSAVLAKRNIYMCWSRKCLCEIVILRGSYDCVRHSWFVLKKPSEGANLQDQLNSRVPQQNWTKGLQGPLTGMLQCFAGKVILQIMYSVTQYTRLLFFFYYGVLYFQNVARFHGTRVECNFIYGHMKSAHFHCADFHETHKPSAEFVCRSLSAECSPKYGSIIVDKVRVKINSRS
jgi:hypothetical protein